MLFKFRVRLGVTALALGATLVTGAAYAQDAKKIINAANIINYPPYSFKDLKSGAMKGFDIDLFEAMAKKAGATVSWSEFSYADLLSFAPLKTGRVDIYGGSSMPDTPERRENGVSFIDYLYEPLVLFTLKASEDQFKGPYALCGKRVAFSRSNVTTSALLNNLSEENCARTGKPAVVQVTSDSTPAAVLMLKQAGVDAAVSGATSVANFNKEGGNIYVAFGKPLNKSMYGMAFLNQKKELGEALKKALDELIADGTYVQLLQKWELPEGSSIEQASINAGRSMGK
ncbi:transporter substrate-binding domain-containing protein [Bradyrhizobium tunisiense]|uniref:transporter substrate-binding domain-containing protein n=1 Tax=Bradyrhizobium tunisiense TaxID=3278709 RepID=UPI0035E0EEFD